MNLNGKVMVSNMIYGMQNNNIMTNPILNTGMGDCSAIKNYTNDIMYPLFLSQMGNEFSYANLGQVNALQGQYPQNNSVFALSKGSSNPQTTEFNTTFTGKEPVNPSSVNLDKTLLEQQENKIEKTNNYKKISIVAGLLTPIVRSIYNFATGTKFTDAFKLKELGIKMPFFAIAGWCLGAVTDSITNSCKFEKEN